jgi:hypothetical protein
MKGRLKKESYMDGINNGPCDLWGLGRMAQRVGFWLVDGPKQLLSDVDATTDLLKLTQRIHRIIEPIIQFMSLKLVAEAATNIVEFFNARNFAGTISDLVSGKAAWEKPFSEHFPNLLKVASKLSFLIADIGLLAGWLSSVHVLGEWVKTSTAQLVTWGKKFNVLQGICDVSCITGSLLSLGDTIRIIVQEVLEEGVRRDGRLNPSRVLDHCIDIASDITSIAATVLLNIPGVPIVMATVSLAIGSTLALGRFFKKTYFDAPGVQADR